MFKNEDVKLYLFVIDIPIGYESAELLTKVFGKIKYSTVCSVFTQGFNNEFVEVWLRDDDLLSANAALKTLNVNSYCFKKIYSTKKYDK